MKHGQEEVSSEVVSLAQAGNAAAFDQICVVYEKYVYAICLKTLKNPAEAEEIAQDVFVRAFEQIKNFRRNSKLSTWLFRIAINFSLMRMRHKDWNANCSLDEMMETKEGRSRRQIETVDRRQRSVVDRFTVDKVLKTVSKKHRTVLILFHFEDRTTEEIAAIEGITVPAAKSRLSRGRYELRCRLEGKSMDQPAVSDPKS